MKADLFEQWIRRKTCTACAILRKDTLAFILDHSFKEDSEGSDVTQVYLLHYLPDESGQTRKKDFGLNFKGGSRRRLAIDHAKADLLCVSLMGLVLFHTPQSGKSEQPIPETLMLTVLSVKYIGSHFYAAGGRRSVVRRDGVDQWTDLTADIRAKGSLRVVADFGFNDIDGFNETDIYAVGGQGDAWRFDGQHWYQQDLPTDQLIHCVCCASDGFVYIGGRDHIVLKGREGQWHILHEDDSNRRFKQIVEYQGHLLAVDEWGNELFEITEEGVRPFDTGDYSLRPGSCLRLAVGHGMLLTAGVEAANLFDGHTWRSVFRPASAGDEELAYDLLRKAQETVEQLNQRLEDLVP